MRQAGTGFWVSKDSDDGWSGIKCVVLRRSDFHLKSRREP